MKSIGSKISKIVIGSPTLITFGLALGITVAIGAAIGMLDHQQVLAFGHFGHFGAIILQALLRNHEVFNSEYQY